MTDKQQGELLFRREMLFLWMAVGIIVLMCLFPPWAGYIIKTSGGSSSAGSHYAWLFSSQVRLLDFPRLVVQCAFVALLAGAAIYTSRISTKK